MTEPKTKRQKAVLQQFIDAKAVDKSTATTTNYRALDDRIAVKLVNDGILSTEDGERFWVRQPNEPKTKAYTLIYVYGWDIILDGKKHDLAFLRFDRTYSWKTMLPAITRLAKKIGLTNRYPLMEGMELSRWNETKFPRFDFNGTDFVKAKPIKK